MKPSDSTLFTPFKHHKLTLTNRIIMAPMTRNYSPTNIPGDDVAAYYRRRTEGGVGLIITEGTTVSHKAANGYPGVPYIHGEAALAGWKKVVDGVHEAGGKIIPQLWHTGTARRLGTEPNPEVPGFGPSGIAKAGGKKVAHEMSIVDIKEVVDSFAQAAKDAEKIGFDGVEIHGAHGYLIDQFFWEGTNQRTDEYGGSLQNRLRFGIEIIKAIRAAVSPSFAIVFRYSQWKLQDYTARLVESPEDLEKFLSPLVEAGVDIFHCSTRRFWEPEFEGSDLNLAGWTKKITGLPTITVGSVGLDVSFINEETHGMDTVAAPTKIDGLIERMDNDEFDLVAVGRAILVDPEWPNKIKEERYDDIKSFDKKALYTLS